MNNIGLKQFRYKNVDNFTSDFGIKIRRIINPALRPILQLATKGEIIIDQYPKLEKYESYIFVSLHNFVEDTIANLSTIDRNAYLLFGTSDQLDINPEMYAAWLNGFIYVDRNSKDNRSDALLKMERVLNSGSSVLIFPEGGLNNTENQFCQKLFASPYILSYRTGKKVVPIAPLYEPGSDKIYINVGEPLDLTLFGEKKEALLYLRDVLSTMLYENLIKHSTPLIREELGDDPRMDFMEQRRLEYLKTKWTQDVWDEELTIYKDQDDREFDAVWESMDSIKVTNNNAHIMAPILAKRFEDKRYNFNSYMHNSWNK